MFVVFSGAVAQDSLRGAGMGLISLGPFCLLPLFAWWPFVNFAVVASPLYRVGFIGRFHIFAKRVYFKTHFPCHLLNFCFLFLFLFLYLGSHLPTYLFTDFILIIFLLLLLFF